VMPPRRPRQSAVVLYRRPNTNPNLIPKI